MIDIKIKISNRGYKITNDKLQFILSEVKIQKKETKRYKKGEEKCKDIGYFSNLDGLINRLCMLDLLSKDIETLEELKQELINTRVSFERILNGGL